MIQRCPCKDGLFEAVIRRYSLCCPPRPPPGGCSPPPCTKKINPPPQEHVCRPPIPANPCKPVFNPTNVAHKYKYLAIFMVPVIAFLSFQILGHEPPLKGECRDYEFMRRRTKSFPWGDHVKSFFHNDHTNHLPGECSTPPADCKDKKK